MPPVATAMTETRKAWQEPMVWLMAGIPALTVIAGLYTLFIAFHSGPLDVAPASVQRVGQAQTLSSIADQLSTDNNYHGFLVLDKSSQPWTLTLKLVPSRLASNSIQVVFVHPQRADQDIIIQLPSQQSTIAMQPVIGFKPQQIVVSDNQNQWRLVGTDSGQSSITLTPALSAQ